jgi:hypothetical protein
MLDQIKVKINGEEYVIKKSFRALMLFEETTGRNVDQLKETVSDLMLLFFCILKANNREKFLYNFEEFLDSIDEHPDTVEVFNDFLLTEAKKNTESQPKKKAKNQ